MHLSELIQEIVKYILFLRTDSFYLRAPQAIRLYHYHNSKQSSYLIGLSR